MVEGADVVLFGRLLEALDPWLGDIVIVGGWAHRLYRSHPNAQSPRYRLIVTGDADVALPGGPLLKDADIRRRLLDHEFNEEFRGEDIPPVTRYRLGTGGAFYAEFLTPLVGAPQDRKGLPKATVEVGGVTAQRLRHLDLLLISPWRVDFAAGQEVRIPNPSTFLAQKLLIHEKRRDAEDRAKDILYVHDTLEIFGPRLERLHEEWLQHVRPGMTASTAARVTSIAGRMFQAVSDDIRRAARIPADRRILPDDLRAACKLGLGVVFGEGG